MRVPITRLIKRNSSTEYKHACHSRIQISLNTFRVIIESLGGVDIEGLSEVIQNAKPAHLTAEYGIRYMGSSDSSIRAAVVTGNHYTISSN